MVCIWVCLYVVEWPCPFFVPNVVTEYLSGHCSYSGGFYVYRKEKRNEKRKEERKGEREGEKKKKEGKGKKE